MREHNLLSMSEDQIFELVRSSENISATRQLQSIFESDPIYGQQVLDLLNVSAPETRAFVTFLARTIVPASYLEVGVRRGWSTCAVGLASPNCDIYAFDGWHINYGGVPNPGPDFVQAELAKFGYTKPVTFVGGDSHQTLPAFFAQHPNKMLEMILIDGDHSVEGARRDLLDTMPHVALGGIMIFDDIFDIPPLHNVWTDLSKDFPNFKYFSFARNKPGVGFAIRTQ